jgi:hypothetical protein
MKRTQKKSSSSIDAIKNDIELRPLFIDYIAENFKMSMASFYKLEKKEQTKFKSSASKSLITLTEKLESKVGDNDLYSVIETVCKHYTQFIALTSGNIFNDQK